MVSKRLLEIPNRSFRAPEGDEDVSHAQGVLPVPISRHVSRLYRGGANNYRHPSGGKQQREILQHPRVRLGGDESTQVDDAREKGTHADRSAHCQKNQTDHVSRQVGELHEQPTGWRLVHGI